MLPYENPALPAETRVADLLARMTLEEKAGQLNLFDVNSRPLDWFRERHVGLFINVFGPRTAELQRELGDRHRLRIPVAFTLDCIHGHGQCPGATFFPIPLALACAWDPDLHERIGRATAREMTVTGLHWTYAPNLDVTRDLRWGRVEETLGEDPFLVGQLAAAQIHGLQGRSPDDPNRVLACGKHFAGYSESVGGRDATECLLSERQLRQTHFPAYRAAIAAGLATVMAGYHAWDGTPCSMNRRLLRDLLRDELGFGGIVISDYDNIRNLTCEHSAGNGEPPNVRVHRICTTMDEAAALTLNAGNDVNLASFDNPEGLVNGVRSGAIPLLLVDEAVGRVLTAKFRLGLFDERRHAPLAEAAETLGCADHLELCERAARESLVLLKNQDAVLPFDSAVRSIAVVGPYADEIFAQLGCWTMPLFGPEPRALVAEDARIISVARGLREAGIRRGVAVHVEPGCGTLDAIPGGLAAAEAACRGAEIIVAVVGDPEEYHGETRDSARLELPPAQQRLLETARAAGRPLVVVLLSSKPLAIPWIAEHADALVVAFHPGMHAGKAVADLLFGEFSPSGKLPVSFPAHVGQLPVHYNQTPGWHGPGHHRDLPPETARPLYVFGDGLGYTTFRYDNLRVDRSELAVGEELAVTVSVTNVGARDGIETVQLYVQDPVASVVRPRWQLRGFTRVTLAAGETKTARLTLPHDALALLDAGGRWVVEPGEFILAVGGSFSPETALQAGFSVVAG